MQTSKKRWQIDGEKTIVRLATVFDVPAILAYYKNNQEFLQPFEPLRPALFFESLYWQLQVMQNMEDFEKGISLKLFVFERQSPQKVQGVINFSGVSKGAFQNAYLGYGLSEECQGKGIMYDALQHSIEFVFERWNLHRISANYMPRNQRSAKLLQRLGFRVEGFAYDYLLINGKWEDHILTSKINCNWKDS